MPVGGSDFPFHPIKPCFKPLFAMLFPFLPKNFHSLSTSKNSRADGIWGVLAEVKGDFCLFF